jgi:hypothetical protein
MTLVLAVGHRVLDPHLEEPARDPRRARDVALHVLVLLAQIDERGGGLAASSDWAPATSISWISDLMPLSIALENSAFLVMISADGTMST